MGEASCCGVFCGPEGKEQVFNMGYFWSSSLGLIEGYMAGFVLDRLKL